jgi:hypothetical protein
MQDYRTLVRTLEEVLEDSKNIKENLCIWCKELGNKGITLYLTDNEIREELLCFGPNPNPGIIVGHTQEGESYSIFNVKNRYKIIMKD